MNLFEPLFEELDALPDILRPGIVRAVCEPWRNIPALERIRNPHTVQYVVYGLGANADIWITNRSVFVLLVLENVRIDRTGPNPEALAELPDLGHICQAVRRI